MRIAFLPFSFSLNRPSVPAGLRESRSSLFSEKKSPLSFSPLSSTTSLTALHFSLGIHELFFLWNADGDIRVSSSFLYRPSVEEWAFSSSDRGIEKTFFSSLLFLLLQGSPLLELSLECQVLAVPDRSEATSPFFFFPFPSPFFSLPTFSAIRGGGSLLTQKIEFFPPFPSPLFFFRSTSRFEIRE